ncbi:hypothetical protein [Salaquimonas pukyongi]|uniref:hypothetical protein n=1 Tax=Salaquimonas pukyongi TaxID=2712698 RepID=UPI0012EB6412|nr:hypothetical protein [Salaquimonas pukyongi]
MSKKDFAKQSLVIDSNLLVLLLVGRVRQRYVGRHRRLRDFTVADYVLLESWIATFDRLVTCSYVLAETSNLYRYCDEPLLSGLHGAFADVVHAATEFTPNAEVVVEHVAFPRLGATDAACLCALEDKGDHVLLTADVMLYLAACELRLNAVNFNHLRNVG